MTVLGVLLRKGMTRGEWTECVEHNDFLVTPEPRDIINPFTGKPTRWVERNGAAKVVWDGQPLGALEPSSDFEEKGEILIWGPDDPVPGRLREAVDLVSAILQAEVEWFDD